MFCEKGCFDETETKLIEEVYEYSKSGNKPYFYATWDFLQLYRKFMNREPIGISTILFCNADKIFEEIKEENKVEQRIYIAEFSDATVKIGISINPDRRVHCLATQKGAFLKRYAFSECDKRASKIEKMMHENFKESRINGEYFSISFEDAISKLKEIIGENISIAKVG